MAIKKAARKSPAAKKRKQNPRRFHVLHNDGSVENATRTIERTFGLPEGSVKLVYQTGRKARSDSTVGAVKRNWGVDL